MGVKVGVGFEGDDICAFVWQMTMVLLTVPELGPLRDKLVVQSPPHPPPHHHLYHHQEQVVSHKGGQGMGATVQREDTLSSSICAAGSRQLFEDLWRTWRHFPASALCLCLVAGEYEMASEVVYSIGLLMRSLPPHETLEVLVQLDKLVQVIKESPCVHVARDPSDVP